MHKIKLITVEIAFIGAAEVRDEGTGVPVGFVVGPKKGF